MPNQNLTSNQHLAMEYLRELGFVDISTTDDKNLLVMSKEFIINKSYKEIIAKISNDFPLKYPEFYINDSSLFLKYPHIERKNYNETMCKICLNADESKIYYDEPTYLIHHVYKDLEKYIEYINKGNYHKNEIFDEFDSYWNNYPLRIYYNKDIIEQYENFKVLDLYILKRSKQSILFVEKKENIAKLSINTKLPFEEQKVVFINFKDTIYEKIPTTYSELKDLLSKLGHLEKIKKLKNDKKIMPLFLFSFDITSLNQKHIAGIYFDEVKRKGIKNFIPSLFNVNNINKEFMCINAKDTSNTKLYTRGGDLKKVALNNLDKRIAIIGCGSVGSAIAFKLLKMGCNNLLLIDPQYLSSDNIARHILGIEYLEENKAKALKVYLERQFLNTNIEAIEYPIEDDFEILENVDLIVSAIGSDANHIEEYILRLSIKEELPPTISCWVEAGAVIGHSILINKDLSSIDEFNMNKFFSNITYLNSDLTSKLKKKDIGCNSSYMPYTYLNADLHINHFSNMITKYILDEKIHNVWSSIGEVSVFREYIKKDKLLEDNTLIKRSFDNEKNKA